MKTTRGGGEGQRTRGRPRRVTRAAARRMTVAATHGRCRRINHQRLDEAVDHRYVGEDLQVLLTPDQERHQREQAGEKQRQPLATALRSKEKVDQYRVRPTEPEPRDQRHPHHRPHRRSLARDREQARDEQQGAERVVGGGRVVADNQGMRHQEQRAEEATGRPRQRPAEGEGQADRRGAEDDTREAGGQHVGARDHLGQPDDPIRQREPLRGHLVLEEA
jgi:hypothetical protein